MKDSQHAMQGERADHFLDNSNFSKPQQIDMPKRGAATSTGQFFPIYMYSIRCLLQAGGSANELGAYVVLARGAGSYASTAWTEHAIATRLGITGGKAEKACMWLEKHGFLKVSPAYQEHKLTGNVMEAMDTTTKKARSAAHKWIVLREGNEIVYLPNSLVDGLGSDNGTPPFRTLFNEVNVDFTKNINIHLARLDALALLLELYAVQDIEQFGGIDPHVWHREWEISEIDKESNVFAGTGFRLVEIVKDGEVISAQFVHLAFAHVEGEDVRLSRFYHALDNLKKLGLFYEVLQIWDDNPLEACNAEVLYPLYIFDSYALRNGEPSLHRAVNRVAIEVYTEKYGPDHVFDPVDGSFQLTGSDFYRYIAYDHMPSAFALSVLRLRYRAWDRDNGIGLAEQQRMVDDWGSVLDDL